MSPDAPLYPSTRQTTYLLAQPGPFRVLGGDYEASPPNVLSAYGIEDVRGYQSLYLARYNRLTRLIDGKDQTAFFLGDQKTSNREDCMVWLKDELHAVKWKDFKINFKRQQHFHAKT